MWRESFCGVVADMLDCYIIVIKFELESHYTVHFEINTFGKGKNPLNSLLWVKYDPYCSSSRMVLALNNHKVIYAIKQRNKMKLSEIYKHNLYYTMKMDSIYNKSLQTLNCVNKIKMYKFLSGEYLL